MEIYARKPNSTDFTKEIFVSLMEYRPSASVYDPLVPANNVTKSMYRIEEIQEILRAAFLSIGYENLCYCGVDKNENSILAKICSCISGLAMANKMKNQYYENY